MRSFFLIWICFFSVNLLMVESSIYAESESLQKQIYDPWELISQIEKKASQVTSANCTFIQKKQHPMFSHPIVFHGTISFMRPDKLRWEYISPLPSVIVVNGSQGYRCDGEDILWKFDLNNDPVLEPYSKMLKSWLSGNYSNFTDFFEVSRPEDLLLILTPRTSSKNKVNNETDFMIKIYFHSDTLTPSKIIISEKGDRNSIAQTDITLVTCQENSDLPDASFKKCNSHN